MIKYDINKNQLENRIFNEVNEYGWCCNAKELHERIVSLLAEELSEYVDAEKVFEELVSSGAFKKLKVNKEDLKKIAVDNLIIEIVEQYKRYIDSSWNLMPLATINFDVIQEEDYCDVLDSLNPQLTSVLKKPIYREALTIVEKALKDGEIFEGLIQGEEHIIELEQENPDDRSEKFIKDSKKNIARYKVYKDEKAQKLLINSIAKRIASEKISYIVEDKVEQDPTIRQDINNTSKNVELYMNDVEDAIYSKNYAHVLRKVPDDEFLRLIQNASLLAYREVPTNDDVPTRKKNK